MKYRSGFVSNSSSSSFVAVGIEISDRDDIKQKFVDEDNYELSKEGKKLLPKNSEYNYYEGCGEVIGWVIGDGSSDDGSFECQDVDFDDLKKYAEALEKATGVKARLMGGTYAS